MINTSTFPFSCNVYLAQFSISFFTSTIISTNLHNLADWRLQSERVILPAVTSQFIQFPQVGLHISPQSSDSL